MPADSARDRLIVNRVLLSTASNYVGRILTLGTWFFLTPFILSRLGPTSYGLWVLVSSVVAYGWLFDLGLAGAVTKYVAEHRARGDFEAMSVLCGTALALYLGLGLAFIVIAAAAAPLFPALFNVAPDQEPTVVALVVLMGLGVGLSIPGALTLAILRGLQRYDLINLLTVASTLISAAAAVAVLLLGRGVVALVAVNLPITLGMQIPALWMIRRLAPELRLSVRRARREMIRPITSFSTALFVSSISSRLQTRSDEIVIGLFLPVSFVTPYSIARRLSEMAQTLTEQFMKVLLPLASELHAESDSARLRALYVNGTRLTLVLFLPIGCALVILAAPTLEAWVGAEYAGYGHLVTILTLVGLVNASQWPAGSVLQGMARYWPVAILSACSALVNVILSVALVRPLGLTGVALGTLLPTVVVSLGAILPYAMRVIGVSLSEAVREIALPALLPAAPLVLVLLALREVVPPTLIAVAAAGAAGLAVYVVAYLALGASPGERALCARFARQTLQVARGRLGRP